MKKLKEIYARLFKHYGPQHWWPAKTKFEVIVGAILVQNTNWGNVEKALNNLKANKILSPDALRTIIPSKLASLIQPAGYFNVKTKRLKNFITFFFDEYDGSMKNMKKESLAVLRPKLLSINGIGLETADSILLYAFDKPIFVVDAYTKRLLSRHGIITLDTDYHAIQNIFMECFTHDAKMFNEYHALIVQVGKDYCKPKPRCEQCLLRSLL
ncbi:Endonuclease III [hydrothermal vent metagenome]|uniref:Endonuclease III n=1 Tax=hydrothermal vent metagenome TaxID=652676 RepID=A0A3B1D439_9ZZZZ